MRGGRIRALGRGERRISAVLRRVGGTAVFIGGMFMLSGFSAAQAPYGTPLQLTIVGGRVPLVLGRVDQSLVLERWDGERWDREMVMSLPSGARLISAALAVGHGQAIVAVETSRGRGPQHLVVLCRDRWSAVWTRVLASNVPTAAAGSLDLAVRGRDAWLLTSGLPLPGPVPKVLWLSANGGRTWMVEAADAVSAPVAPFLLPRGYATGAVATDSGALVMTLRPYTGGTDIAVYRPDDRAPRFFALRPGSGPVGEALPALVSQNLLTVPLIQKQAGTLVLAEATTSPAVNGWAIRPLGQETAIPRAVVSGRNVDILIDARALQVVSGQGFVGETGLSTGIRRPVVGAVMPNNQLVVWGPGSIFREYPSLTPWPPEVPRKDRAWPFGSGFGAAQARFARHPAPRHGVGLGNA
jgi:hypothetical protein